MAKTWRRLGQRPWGKLDDKPVFREICNLCNCGLERFVWEDGKPLTNAQQTRFYQDQWQWAANA